MTNKIKIHFVCNGNVYRSRLAAAYLKSIAPDLEISSSGLHTERHPAETIADWARDISRHYHLTDFIAGNKTQTTSEILQNQDIIVFMRQSVYDEAKQKYNFNHQKGLVWNIKDKEDWHSPISNARKKQLTFQTIKHQSDKLLSDVRSNNWVDIFDEHNQSANCSLPINIANSKDRGNWRRTCHAIITLPNNHVLIQKRSKNMIFAPRMLDISLGGLVDCHESPQDAIIREVKEEIGLDITNDKVSFMGVYKQASYHPKYKKLSRHFTYAYHITLDSNHPPFIKQDSEVDDIKILSIKQTTRLIKRHRIAYLGRLNYTYKFYQNLLDMIEK